MIKALAITAAATAAVISPAVALAQHQSGTLAGFDGQAMENGRLDVIQLYGPRGPISIAVDCVTNNFTWVGQSGDQWIAERAAYEWCF